MPSRAAAANATERVEERARRGGPSVGGTGDRAMQTYEIKLVWRGGTYSERVQAMTSERARRAVLERFSGATIMRVVKVE